LLLGRPRAILEGMRIQIGFVAAAALSLGAAGVELQLKDNELALIQENVIARAITSLQFTNP
jgi:hypothetical protein